MKLFLGLLESASPHQTRIFGEVDGKFLDLKLAYAAYLAQNPDSTNVYGLASYYFPQSITAFLERGEPARKALVEVVSFACMNKAGILRGPAGEKALYDPSEIRLQPPIRYPEKSFVIGFADKARMETPPKSDLPTGYYKLPQTFVTGGAPILWPIFSKEVDADACLALVIGKAGRRVAPEKAWDHVAGVTLLIDITARDINQREGATANNLLGKNFPSSTALGPAVLLTESRNEIENLVIELFVDGRARQRFTLRECVFSVEQIIARWSMLGIKPGDFIAIGASMVLQGQRLQQPVALTVGSTMRCASSEIGELTHSVLPGKGARA